MKFLPWKKDQWFSTNGNILKYDKLEHFLISFIGYLLLFITLTKSHLVIVLIIEILGIGWEIKDGLIPYDKKGNIEGFSWKDLIANNLGIFIAWLIL